MTVAALAGRLRAGELSPREAVQDYLDRIEARRDLNAYLAVRAEEALAEADALAHAPVRGPLHGVPIAVKDIIDVAGTPTTAASKILDRVPERDAEVVARLRAAGAVVLGKLNTHEFACGASTTSVHFGPAHNPWDPDRICGGSSGGSACAVAADLAAGTVGTDTSGSIRIPASFCGTTGLRPTHGLVPTDGVFPFAPSFDAVGPLGRSAEDCALLLQAMAEMPPVLDGAAASVRGLRIGVVGALFEREIDPRVAAVVSAAVDELRALGAHVERVELELLERMGTIQQAMQLPEAAAVHAEWLRTRLQDYGEDVRTRLLAGHLLPPEIHAVGARARELACREVERMFERVDLLVAPVMPTLPPRLDEQDVDVDGRRVPYRLSFIRSNSTWSLVGVPAVSVPCGFLDGLPVGLALVGPRFGERAVLGAAHAYQQASDWHERRPAPLGEKPSDTPRAIA